MRPPSRLAIAVAILALICGVMSAMAAPAAAGTDHGHPDRGHPGRGGACDDASAGGDVEASRLMVVAAHPLAAAAGCRVLLDGGTAADAAVAVQAALGVVEPQSSGLGGGTIVLYHDRSARDVRFFDGLAAAPAAVTDGLRTPTDDERTALGVDSFGSETASTARAVGVPGTLAVLDLVHDEFGRRGWSELFDVGIELAEGGFEMAPYLHDTMAATSSGLPRCAYPDLAVRYCEGGEPLPVGTMITNPELAEVLRTVRDGGADAFYDPAGTIAPAIVDATGDVDVADYKVDNDDGTPAVIPSLLTTADFAAYRAVEREPLCDRVLRRLICSASAPSFGGLSVLQQLGLMERAGVGATEAGSIERVHLGIEASRLAQFDRREYVGDPDFGPVPLTALLDPGYLDSRAALLSPGAAVHPIAPGDPVDLGLPAVEPNGTAGDVAAEADTTSNVTIVDARGDAISMTTTINSSFGAQLEASGIALNNVQENFTRLDSISPGQAVNQMESGKRPRTSMAPTLVFDRRGLDIAVGAAGGSAIPDYVTQTILGLTIDDLDPFQAVSQPHWSGQTITSNCAGIIGARSEVEEGTALEELLGGLDALGHPCARSTDLRSGLTVIDVGRRTLTGAADPRRDGAAAGR